MPTITSSPESPAYQQPSRRAPAPTKSGAGKVAKQTRISDSPGNSPLRPTNSANLPQAAAGMAVNDDKAEKASRRKSAHFGDLGVTAEGNAPSGAANPAKSQATKRVVSALAVQAQAHAAAAGTGTGAMARKKGRLSAVNPELQGVSWEQRESNYEEWMKVAIDNKITVTNTWNFALIDYFHDMTLLRNGPDDQSINFQKASSTLDGCVKIWTSRVDSVATETGKLLSGLAGGGGNAEEGDEDEGAEGGEDGDRPKAARKNTSHRSESTLAKSFAALQVKKMDLEFSVDPLFKKTSADFDEGGAMGLLMNHLGVDGRNRVVFDAGDAVVEEGEEEDEVQEELVDLSRLRQYIPNIETTQGLVISESLASFKFSSDPASMQDFTTLLGLKDSWGDEDSAQPSDLGSPSGGGFGGADGPVDFFGDEDFNVPSGMGFDSGSVAGDDDYMNNDPTTSASLRPSGSGLGMGQPGEHLAPFDPRRQGGELVMALAGEGAQEGMWDYFDTGFGGRGWAGAEHWKLRKVAKKDPGTPTQGAKRAEKAPKAAFTIDFSGPLPAECSSKALFATATRSSISLPESSRSKKGKKKDENLLPDDMHFSSRQLVRLFMKPKFALRMRKDARAQKMVENPGQDIDENFWAQAAAERIDGAEADAMGSSLPVPFESQFFNEPDDGTEMGDYAFVDDALDGDGDESSPPAAGEDGEDDLWKGTQGTIRKARPENVNFAKKAKRVDVKRLKDDIWSGLKTLVPQPAAPPSTSSALRDPFATSDSEPEVSGPETPIGEPKTFDGIITSLRRAYPKDKMSEISTSFCFICLLHLANEEGLRIEAARYDGLEGEDVGCQGVLEMDLPSVEGAARKGRGGASGGGGGVGGEEKIVGELQALRVFKDPNAGRAA